jgi:hypothetical protein
MEARMVILYRESTMILTKVQASNVVILTFLRF